MRENYTKTPHGRAVNRRAQLKRKYGITPEDYEVMLEMQGGHCALCNREPLPSKRLCVDHCHETGAIRGLLCDIHNRSLGYLGDNEDAIMRVLKYLRQSPYVPFRSRVRKAKSDEQDPFNPESIFPIDPPDLIGPPDDSTSGKDS